jgi:hypothetical protein
MVRSRAALYTDCSRTYFIGWSTKPDVRWITHDWCQAIWQHESQDHRLQMSDDYDDDS